MNLRYLSVCSGVEAASLAWRGLGWSPFAFAEVRPFQSAVLASRFPTVPNLGNLEKINANEKVVFNDLSTLSVPDGGIDLLVGGTPCQSFSAANFRGEGLAGKSGLALSYVRILRDLRPRWFVWENVAGAISSVSGGKRDFNFLLAAFAQCGYDVEWRMLDASVTFTPGFPRAVAARRPRVFVVGRRAGFAPFPILCDPAEVGDSLAQSLGLYAPSTSGAAEYGDGAVCTTTGGDVFGTMTVSGLNSCDLISLKSGAVIYDGRHCGRFPIRMATPLECERMLGFPDGWTIPQFTPENVDAAVAPMMATCAEWSRICGRSPRSISPASMRAKLLAWSDSRRTPWTVRLECCGNSMAVNCMEWIGRRIEWAEATAERMRKGWR